MSITNEGVFSSSTVVSESIKQLGINDTLRNLIGIVLLIQVIPFHTAEHSQTPINSCPPNSITTSKSKDQNPKLLYS